MRAWLFVLALAACKYNTPEPGATTGDASGDGAPVDEAVIDPIDAPPGAWMHPYLHRKRITLIASKIDDTGGALTSFPVLISLDDGDLAAATNLPDMAFTAGDATTQLDSEIESYASGKLVAWVRIPDLSATQNTQIFLYYGNPSPPPTNPEGVWSGGFLGVWHLSQDPGSGGAEIRDATAGNRDGQANGMVSQDLDPAQVGNGFSFDGSNDFVDFPTIDLGNAFTISAWA
jgi:biopolymer transport protein ExbB